ncbi:8-amino-7-oxononanoate synthase [Acidimicrobiia bacterium EGI L10123]|uniref:aminotransferase class I/II-fold pyridoxal phosphate-dependent enzyme n=1 Tax=Salinilacustrithrix flava TaxID=2957203 RepID=UPI003D7C33CF|nr:8-amino-7-oxononanoate synthase [Acidimicrobiia bacterium EGI L10123]
MSSSHGAWVRGELDAIRGADRWRHSRPFDALGPAGSLEGRPVVSFASNDYLGLSAHPTVVAAGHEALDRWGTGSTASRLVVGSRPVHHDLEAALAGWKGTEAAVAMPSGYAANLAVLTTFGGPDCLVVSDELNHASIIDGCRLSRSEVAVSRHGEVDHVDELLRNAGSRRAMVVTDSVFSMDGDEAPVQALAECCARHGALLVLDDAHAVLGPDVDLAAVDGLDVVHVLTLSKALGSLGGAIAGSRDAVDLVVNRARPFIFTTALSPADAAAALAAVHVVRSPEGDALVGRLRGHVDRLRPGHPSPIIPVVLGEEQAALDAAGALLDQGLLVPAIRPPTVAPGTSRLRVALSAAHTDDQISTLVAALHPLRTGSARAGAR